MEKHINFLAIGDIAIDNFIQLKDAHITCNINHENCELCLKFGQKVPYEKSTAFFAAGNSANAAVAASRLGLRTALVSTLGDDENGKYCLGVLKKEKINRKYINIDKKGNLTNYHFVLMYGNERTILVKHAPFEYVLPKKNLKVDWIYLSSIGEHSPEFHNEISKWLKEKLETKMAFQPGTFQIKLDSKFLKEIYERTEIFFCNKEESQQILKTEEKDIEKLLKGIHDLGPKKVVITDGSRGLSASDGVNIYKLPMYPDPNRPVDRTGAGDAASATITAMLAMGKDFKEAIKYGPINSMSVVREMGTQKGLLSKKEIEEYLKNAPESYRIN